MNLLLKHLKLQLLDNLKLRKAKFNDSSLLLEWANDADMRNNSFHSKLINKDDHIKWFKKKLTESNDTSIYILELSETPIGQIRFERIKNGCLIDFFITKGERGKGYGKNIILMGVEKIINKWKNIDFISAEVKKDNTPSKKVFIDLNFTETSYPDRYLYTLKV